jgi:hypothetical protein
MLELVHPTARSERTSRRGRSEAKRHTGRDERQPDNRSKRTAPGPCNLSPCAGLLASKELAERRVLSTGVGSSAARGGDGCPLKGNTEAGRDNMPPAGSRADCQIRPPISLCSLHVVPRLCCLALQALPAVEPHLPDRARCKEDDILPAAHRSRKVCRSGDHTGDDHARALLGSLPQDMQGASERLCGRACYLTGLLEFLGACPERILQRHRLSSCDQRFYGARRGSHRHWPWG